MENKTHTIDATNQKLGRVATQAAVLLMGKDTPDFERHFAANVTVNITNASKADISEKKKKEKIYTHYTGHPGGLRKQTAQKIIDTKGYRELFKKAVYGMLPSNKLRAVVMKNLSITE